MRKCGCVEQLRSKHQLHIKATNAAKEIYAEYF